MAIFNSYVKLPEGKPLHWGLVLEIVAVLFLHDIHLTRVFSKKTAATLEALKTLKGTSTRDNKIWVNKHVTYT